MVCMRVAFHEKDGDHENDENDKDSSDNSEFLKRALAQTCFRVWYQVRFLRRIFGHSWGLVCGEGGTPGTVPLHNLRVTSHVLHQEVPLGWYRVRLF